ncbi:hypothetical protein [Streptacidiphilus melanogenes]|uniref:hypothetical protein n=1 Tax=Streptacidiphilus melanogenes TaxID=411235 RepID=UPI000B2A8322|nr:hypothetical protein [Streptacidiphilus melanogenes]
MTTRLTKVSTKAPKRIVVSVHCPACCTTRRCISVGTGVVDGRRREIVRCTDKSCETEFLPKRRHLAAAA